jgi:leader peptidase (prepilin peptidase)/N-methyltransferase
VSDGVFIGICVVLGVVAGWALRPTLQRFDAAVPARLPAPEVLTGLLFGLAGAQYDTWRLSAVLVLLVSSVALSIVDLRQYRLPNAIMFPALVASAVIVALGELIDGHAVAISHAAVGAVLYCFILLLMHLINPAGMGFGDVKLALLLGLFVGWVSGSKLDSFRAVMIALLIGSALGVVLGFGRILTSKVGKSFLPDPEEGSAGDGLRHTTFSFGGPLDGRRHHRDLVSSDAARVNSRVRSGPRR